MSLGILLAVVAVALLLLDLRAIHTGHAPSRLVGAAAGFLLVCALTTALVGEAAGRAIP